MTVRVGDGVAVPLAPRVIGATPERRRQEGGTVIGSRLLVMPGERRPRLVEGEWARCTTPLELLTLHLGWWTGREAELFRRAGRDFARLATEAGVRRPRVTPRLGPDDRRTPSAAELVEMEEDEELAGRALAGVARRLPQGAYDLLFALLVLQELPAPLRELRDWPASRHLDISMRCEEAAARLEGDAAPGTPLRVRQLLDEARFHRTQHAAFFHESAGGWLALDRLRRTVTLALEALVDAMGTRLPPGWQPGDP